jgi:isocitrate dehydrogenase
MKPLDLETITKRLTDVSSKTISKVDGVDVFVQFKGNPGDLGPILEEACGMAAMKLKMTSNRGTKVYPGKTETSCVDHWRCRFIKRNGKEISDRQIYVLLFQMTEKNLKWVHIEKLQDFDEKPAYTKAQGEVYLQGFC